MVSWKERKLYDVFQSLEKGSNLLLPELSRLGRSMLEIMEILSIATSKGINIYAVKGNWQLDNTIQSSIIAMAFAMASGIERELISQRTKESLRAKKLQGIKLGRPKGTGKSKLDKFRPEIEGLLKNGSTKKFIANRYDITEQGFNHWLRRNNIK